MSLGVRAPSSSHAELELGLSGQLDARVDVALADGEREGSLSVPPSMVACSCGAMPAGKGRGRDGKNTSLGVWRPSWSHAEPEQGLPGQLDAQINATLADGEREGALSVPPSWVACSCGRMISGKSRVCTGKGASPGV